MSSFIDDIGKIIGQNLEKAGIETADIEKITQDFESNMKDFSGLDFKSDEWITDMFSKDPEAFAKTFASIPGGFVTCMRDTTDLESVFKTMGVDSKTADKYIQELSKGAVSDDTIKELQDNLEDIATERAGKVDAPALKDFFKNTYKRMGQFYEMAGKMWVGLQRLAMFMLVGEIGILLFRGMGGTCTIKSAPTSAKECTKISAPFFGKNPTFIGKTCSISKLASPVECDKMAKNKKNGAQFKNGTCSFQAFPKNATDCTNLKQLTNASDSSFDGTCCTLKNVSEDTCKSRCLQSCDDGTNCFQGKSFGSVLACIVNPACLLGSLVKGLGEVFGPFMWIFYIVLYLAIGSMLYKVLHATGLTSLLGDAWAKSDSSNQLLLLSGQGFMVVIIGLMTLGVTTGEFNQLTNTTRDSNTSAYPPSYTNPMAWALLIVSLVLSGILGNMQAKLDLSVFLKYLGGVGLVVLGIFQVSNRDQLNTIAGVDPATKNYLPLYTNLGFYASVLPAVAYAVGAMS